MASLDKEIMAAFEEVGDRPYIRQAQFFLNAMWPEHKDSAENVWNNTHKFMSLDKLGKDGHKLDEFNSHKFLESLGETMTVIELRQKLREIDVNNDGCMSLIEYLINKYKVTVELIMSRPQGTNEELERAQAALEKVQQEIDELERKKADLEEKSRGTGVKSNAAKQQLFELLNNDPLELNKAVVTAEAAVRRAKKLDSAVAQGVVWWMERELEEAKKYKPKGGLSKGKFEGI